MAVQTTGHYSHASPWVIGFATFAGSLMLLGGIFQMLQGIVAIINKKFYITSPNYIFTINVTTWGWVSLIMGAIIAIAGIYVFSGRLWARSIGIVLAILSAIANFFYIPYYPVWAVMIIALDVMVIWALASYGREEAASL